MFEQYVGPVVEFVRTHQVWAAPIVGVLAFAESLAFLSVFVPAWGIIVAVGALIGAGALPFAPIWIAAAIGAALGDWISWWIGWRFKDRIHHMWPLKNHPKMLAQGESFFLRWGMMGVIVGRFFGPLRATVPLFAGIFEMPALRFQIANWASAFLWAWVLLGVGDVGLGAFSAVRAQLGW